MGEWNAHSCHHRGWMMVLYLIGVALLMLDNVANATTPPFQTNLVGNPSCEKSGGVDMAPWAANYMYPDADAYCSADASASMKTYVDGDRYFSGGTKGTAWIEYTIDLKDFLGSIQKREVQFLASARIGGKGLSPDTATVSFYFLDKKGTAIGYETVLPEPEKGLITPARRGNRDKMLHQQMSEELCIGTSVERVWVRIKLNDTNGDGINDAAVDLVSFKLFHVSRKQCEESRTKTIPPTPTRPLTGTNSLVPTSTPDPTRTQSKDVSPSITALEPPPANATATVVPAETNATDPPTSEPPTDAATTNEAPSTTGAETDPPTQPPSTSANSTESSTDAPNTSTESVASTPEATNTPTTTTEPTTAPPDTLIQTPIPTPQPPPPPVPATVKAADTTGTVTASLAGAGGGSAALDAQVFAVMSGMSCASAKEQESSETMKYFISFFAGIGPEMMVVGNTAIGAFVFLVQFILVYVYSRRPKCSFDEASALFRFPNISLVVWTFLYQGIALSTLQVFVNPKKPVFILIGLMGAMVSLIAPISIFYICKKRLRAHYVEIPITNITYRGKSQSRPMVLFRKLVDFNGRWHPADDFFRHGMILRPFRKGFEKWAAQPMLTAGLVALIAVWAPDSNDGCIMQQSLLGLVFLSLALATGIMRPHRTVLLNILQVLSQFGLGVTVLCRMASRIPSAERVEASAENAALITMAIVAVKMLYELALTIWESFILDTLTQNDLKRIDTLQTVVRDKAALMKRQKAAKKQMKDEGLDEEEIEMRLLAIAADQPGQVEGDGEGKKNAGEENRILIPPPPPPPPPPGNIDDATVDSMLLSRVVPTPGFNPETNFPTTRDDEVRQVETEEAKRRKLLALEQQYAEGIEFLDPEERYLYDRAIWERDEAERQRKIRVARRKNTKGKRILGAFIGVDLNKESKTAIREANATRRAPPVPPPPRHNSRARTNEVRRHLVPAAAAAATASPSSNPSYHHPGAAFDSLLLDSTDASLARHDAGYRRKGGGRSPQNQGHAGEHERMRSDIASFLAHEFNPKAAASLHNDQALPPPPPTYDDGDEELMAPHVHAGYDVGQQQQEEVQWYMHLETGAYWQDDDEL